MSEDFMLGALAGWVTGLVFGLLMVIMYG